MLIFCMDCQTVREMSLHGNCGTCGSKAIDIPVRTKRVETPTVDELEKLYQES